MRLLLWSSAMIVCISGLPSARLASSVRDSVTEGGPME